MIKISFILMFFPLVLMAASCANNPKSIEADLAINIVDPNRIRFQGKGSAAGFMLSGSMGPMGIAIGVAIDEGIAKDIQSAADTNGFVIEDLVRSAYRQANPICDISGVDLARYGFKMKSGSDDVAVASIDALIYFTGKESAQMIYPPEQSENFIEIHEASLAELKSNGKVTSKVLLAAIKDIFYKACQ